MRKFFGFAFALFIATSGAAHSQTANGRATDNAPVYTEGNSAPLSLDLSGNLRVNCVDGCSGGSSNEVKIINDAGAVISGAWDNLSRVAVTSAGVDGYSNTGIGRLTSSNAGFPSTLAIAPSVFNGTTWDRMRGDTSGIWISKLPPLPAGTNAIGSVSVTGTVATSGPYLTNAQLRASPVPVDLPARTPENMAFISEGAANPFLVKAGATRLYEISAYSTNEAPVYLKLYDASAAPNCATATPVGVYMVPGSNGSGGGSNVSIAIGKYFATGLAGCIVGGMAQGNTTAVVANTVSVNLTYE